MVMPAMQLAAKVPDVYLQLWSASLLKGILISILLYLYRIKPFEMYSDLQCVLLKDNRFQLK